MTILAIDPGDKQSAYCFIDSEDLRPLRFGKEQNVTVLLVLQLEAYDLVVIERLASYGMPVGRDEKLHLCHDSRAKDANIRRALIDRFATHDLKNGKGTKKNPDWFYGFSSDVWAAYAVGITYIETKLKL